MRHTVASLHQRADAEALRVLHRGKPLHNEAAIFSAQTHNVRNGAEAEQVAIARRDLVLISVQRGSQLKRHADAGEIRMRIGAVGTVRVNHSRRTG